jgi:lipooligosaccharide transport system ATP-binding protein
MTSPDKVIEVRDLVKRFGAITAVNGISFDVARGECVGLLGPNGAGKTSTVRVIECISPADSGRAQVFGIEAGLGAREIRSRIGVVPQDNDLDSDLTVRENLAVFCLFFDMPRRVATDQIATQLAFMELSAKADARIDELSGGMRRRLLIARALLTNPELLILDEPTTGLDPQGRHLIWQRLRSLKERGISTILTTHYMEEASQLCDRVAILDRGKILREGAPRDLTRTLVGEEVVEVRNWQEESEIARALRGIEYTSEVFGDTMYLHCAPCVDIFSKLSKLPGLSVLRRPATLEDVFLKLTGRALNEQ